MSVIVAIDDSSTLFSICIGVKQEYLLVPVLSDLNIVVLIHALWEFELGVYMRGYLVTFHERMILDVLLADECGLLVPAVSKA